MKQLSEVYGNDLLMVFDSSKLLDSSIKKLAIIRTGAIKKAIPDIKTMNYDEDFESLLQYPIPPKTRKPAKLMSLAKTYEVMDRCTYGVLATVINGEPYAFALNYVLVDGEIYFHTGRKGYKLNALGQIASLNIVEDLGMAYNGTHNFRSIQVKGRLVATEDYELKKRILLKYIDHLNKNHPAYVDDMQKTTLVFKMDIDYMMGRENLFLKEL